MLFNKLFLVAIFGILSHIEQVYAATSEINYFEDRDANKSIPVMRFVLRDPTNKNRVCLLNEMKLRLIIPYSTVPDGKMAKQSFDIPLNIPYSGFCNNLSNTLIMTPYLNWSMSWAWTRRLDVVDTSEDGWSSVGAPPEGISGLYKLVNLSLTYSLNNESFPNTTHSGISTVYYDESLFEARVGDPYVCLSVFSFMVGPVTVETSYFRVQAYQNNNVTKFYGSPVECPEDSTAENMLPIIICAILGALLLLAIIGLAISRHTSKQEDSYNAVAIH